MYSHHLTRAIADAQAADHQRSAARSREIASIHPRHHRRAVVAALVATCGLATGADAVAQPADSVTEQVAKPALAARAGDTPADFPNASRAPEYAGPSTIAVVRPERTIVHDSDEVLPIVLAGVALLIALGSAGYTVNRSRGRLQSG
jgi:hypothetical protein